jgi:hypothetical protein
MAELQAGLGRAVPRCFSTTVSVSRMARIATETPAPVLDSLSWAAGRPGSRPRRIWHAIVEEPV